MEGDGALSDACAAVRQPTVSTTPGRHCEEAIEKRPTKQSRRRGRKTIEVADGEGLAFALGGIDLVEIEIEGCSGDRASRQAARLEVATCDLKLGWPTTRTASSPLVIWPRSGWRWPYPAGTLPRKARRARNQPFSRNRDWNVLSRSQPTPLSRSIWTG